MQIEQAPSGTFFVYSNYDSTCDDFDGLSTGSTDKKRFLAAYNPTGQIKWVRGVSDEKELSAHLTYCPGGQLFFGSNIYAGTTKYGPQTVTVPAATTYAGICQYDTSGNFVRAFTIGKVGSYTLLWDLKADTNGKLYALVGTNTTGDFNGLNIPVVSGMGGAMVLVEMDANGQVLSLHLLGRMVGLFSYYALGFMDNHDIVVGGFDVSYAAQIGSTMVPVGASSISRWHPDGTNVWVKPIISGGNECDIYNIIGTPDGNIAFVGAYVGKLEEGFPNDDQQFGNRDVLAAKISGDGQILWARNGEDLDNAGSAGFGIGTDAEANVYLNGLCKGGTVFDFNGLCNPDGDSQGFLVRFNSDGSYGWGACEGGGTGRDLIIQADKTVLSVGYDASNTTFLNHWRNPSLTIQQPNAKYCQGDTLVIAWNVENFNVPQGSYAYITFYNGTFISYYYIGNQSGTSGVIYFPLTFSTTQIFYSLSIGDIASSRSNSFSVGNKPIPSFAEDAIDVCKGTNVWLKPMLTNLPPDEVTWTPSAGLFPNDSIVALAKNVQVSTSYKVTYTNSVDHCSASDSIQLNVYDFEPYITGPTNVYQPGFNFYFADRIGDSPFLPFKYKWYKNGVAGTQSYQYQANITANSLLTVVMTDNAGCSRTDSFSVHYYPPSIILGSVINHDSTAPMPSTQVKLYRIVNQQINPTPQVVQTNAAGQFKFTVAGGDSLMLQVIPDTMLYPMEAPTWYTRKYFVQNADRFWLNTDTTYLDPIFLFNPAMLPDSNGILAGHIESVSFVSGPVAGLTIWIAKADKKPLRYVITDQNGNFSFEHLPYGTYYFLVDKWGIKNEFAPAVSIDAQSPHRIHILGSFQGNQLVLSNTVGISSPESIDIPLDISPNPTSGVFSVRTPERAGRLEVLNAAGLALISRDILNKVGQFEVDLRAFPAGVYWVRWNDAKGGRTIKVVKQ